MSSLGICKLVFSINIIKTLWFNFKAFSVPVALKFPVIVRTKVKILEIGNIIIEGSPRRAMMVLGGVDIKGEGPAKFSNRGTIILHSETGKVIVCQGVIIENYGLIEFKGSSYISENTRMFIREKLEIGGHTRIGFNSCIMDSNDHFLVDMLSHKVRCMTSPVAIGNWNWLGCYTFVKKGTKTPDYLLVSAPYAVLCKDYTSFKEGSIVGGVPAKLLSEGSSRIIYNLVNEQKVRTWFFEHRDVRETEMTRFTDDIDNFCD